MAGNFFRGTSTDQVKCSNQDLKLIKKLEKEGQFPPHFKQSVDMKKVSMDVMKPWISKRIMELLGDEDDIVVEFCIGHLTDSAESGTAIDPKKLQVEMSGFLETKAQAFCSELWKYLLSAQQSPVGVPKEFVDLKKAELKEKKDEADRIQEELKRRRQDLEAMQKQASKADSRRSDRSRSRGGRRSPERQSRSRRKFDD
mmetsp:Transcript_62996/g.150050  ORF Transcript_62996/g.150050 Transcript_62996/m.150050 type:complete len:199 (-) Transcript_62996:111-707(-)